MNELRTLGIDPGSLTTGWGLISGTAAEPRLLDCGVIRLGSTAPPSQRLAVLQRELAVIVGKCSPAIAAVEMPFHGKSARSSLQLAQARGVALAVLGVAGVEVCEYSPAAVKKAVTGSGRADKKQVRSMVQALLRAPSGAQPHDLTDALAVALCHLSTSAFNRAVERAGS